MSTPIKLPDWEAIETAYRAGLLSVRQIGREFAVSDMAIRKRAKRDGWERDLAAKVKAKADAMVRNAEVRRQVRADTVCERDVIDSSAAVMASVVLRSREDIQRGRAFVMKLIGELETMTDNAGLFDNLGEYMKDPERNADKLADAYRKVLSIPGRVDAMKKLTDAMKTLIALEREAFGIDSKKTAGQTLDEFLDDLQQPKWSTPDGGSRQAPSLPGALG